MAAAAVLLVTVILPGIKGDPKNSGNTSGVSAVGTHRLDDKEALRAAKVGDTIIFGAYEQDNNTGNGKEPIEWRVLAKEGNRILVISKYGLDAKAYNDIYTSTTWETCTLRQWLNNDFYNAAFSEEEKAAIPTVTVTAEDNAEYSTYAGKDTNDKVFLLSIREANQYFSSDEDRLCAPTDYAIAQGAWTSDYTTGGRAAGSWWLRSPGMVSSIAAFVRSDGLVRYSGDYVCRGSSVARPALWIDLSETVPVTTATATPGDEEILDEEDPWAEMEQELEEESRKSVR